MVELLKGRELIRVWPERIPSRQRIGADGMMEYKDVDEWDVWHRTGASHWEDPKEQKPCPTNALLAAILFPTTGETERTEAERAARREWADNQPDA
jgi:hypothetical protein